MAGGDLPHLTGVIPRDAEVAIGLLKSQIDQLHARIAVLEGASPTADSGSPVPRKQAARTGRRIINQQERKGGA